jgi:hypothetical protein
MYNEDAGDIRFDFVLLTKELLEGMVDATSKGQGIYIYALEKEDFKQRGAPLRKMVEEVVKGRRAKVSNAWNGYEYSIDIEFKESKLKLYIPLRRELTFLDKQP